MHLILLFNIVLKCVRCKHIMLVILSYFGLSWQLRYKVELFEFRPILNVFWCICRKIVNYNCKNTFVNLTEDI